MSDDSGPIAINSLKALSKLVNSIALGQQIKTNCMNFMTP